MSNASRGRNFESKVAQLLHAAGFEVTLNPGIAKPRQTDLFARGHKTDLLIEAKNQRRKIDVSDIDSMRTRLNRTSADVVGVIFTMSGLTRGAIEAIESDRRREILVFIGQEIEQLSLGTQNLVTLIERKHKQIRVQGKVWFCTETRSEFIHTKFPEPTMLFRLNNEDSPYIESKARFSDALYSLDLPDPSWGLLSGEGIRFSLQLALNAVDDLQDVFGYLHTRFGLSKNGMFAIHQQEISWHGVGIVNFIHALEQWRARYQRDPSRQYHNTEVCRYFDRLDGGWIEVSVQHVVSKADRQFLYRSQLTIQLPGLPVDTTPLMELSRYVGSSGSYFEYVARRLTCRVRLQNSIELDVVGSVIDNDSSESLVVGVIARNPFYGDELLPDELRSAMVSFGRALAEEELLICALQDWFQEGAAADKIMLQGFEATEAGAGSIIKPFGTWNQLSTPQGTIK